MRTIRDQDIYTYQDIYIYIHVIFQNSQIKIWDESVQGFMSYDRKYKQTIKQTEITTLYI